MNKKIKKVISSIMILSLLGGCGTSNNISEDNSNNTNSISEDSVNEESSYTNNSVSKEEIVSNIIFDDIDTSDLERAKECLKDAFITGVDFIFYDKEINGVTWNDLTDSAKETVFNNLIIINDWIDENFPEVKENVSDKYKVVSSFISKKYFEFIDYIKSILSEEQLDNIDEFKDSVSDYIDKGKTKVKTWYEEFRNN